VTTVAAGTLGQRFFFLRGFPPLGRAPGRGVRGPLLLIIPGGSDSDRGVEGSAGDEDFDAVPAPSLVAPPWDPSRPTGVGEITGR
jgi:hypothetical protein